MVNSSVIMNTTYIIFSPQDTASDNRYFVNTFNYGKLNLFNTYIIGQKISPLAASVNQANIWLN